MKRATMMGVLLLLAACGSGGGDADVNDQAAVAETPQAKAERVESAKAALGNCPFRNTGDWHASNEGGRLLVNGRVDLLMAGFEPKLTPRPDSAPGTIAFDLTLEPNPEAAVAERARYETTGSPRYGQAEIWCGGERIARIDMVNI